MMRLSLKILALTLLFTGVNPHFIHAQPRPIVQQNEQKSEADQKLEQGTQEYEAHQYEAAIASLEEALKRYRAIGYPVGETMSLVNLGLTHGALSQHQKSIEYFHQAVSILQSLQNRNGEAIVLMHLGNAYKSRSQYNEAIRHYNQALLIFQALEDRTNEEAVLNNLGLAYSSLSQYDKAISYYNQALSIIRTTQDRRSEAITLLNLGLVYSDLSQYDKAISLYNQALSIFQSIENRIGEAKAFINLGNAYHNLSDYSKALTYYNQALPILQSSRDQRDTAIALMNLGRTYRAFAQYNQAISHFDQALAIFKAVGDRNAEATTLNNLGRVYHDLLQSNKAINFSSQALSIFREINSRNGEALSLQHIGTVYESRGEYDTAIDYYNQSLTIFQSIGNRESEAVSLGNLGNSYRSLSQYDRAIRYYNQAFTIYKAIGDRNSQAKVLASLGRIHDALSQYDKAIDSFNQALPIFRAVQDRDSESIALNNLGATHFKNRQFAQAEQALRAAIAVYETIRLDQLSEENKISLFEGQAKSYRTLQLTLVAQNQPETALTISEWGRSKALIERLSQKQATTSQAPSLDALKQIARSQNATLVEYSMMYNDEGKESQVYIWVIQPNGTISFRQVDLATVLPKQCPTISQLIGNSRGSLGVRSSQSDWLIVDETTQKNPCIQSDSDENFKTLYNILIEPIASLLPTDPTQHIVFIPDRTLFLVPFPALKAKNGQFLIEQHTIRTASSIQLLDKTRTLKANPKGKGALIVGNPFMPNDPGSEQIKQLSNLPNAELEARAIAPLFNTQAITGKAGTKSTILQRISDARIIHLATHGSFYDRNGFKSWLALAPTEQDSGILTAEEVAQLKLSADLVVLSACDTGRGRVTGDGVIGLSRSFITAGVPSVIVSLWSVPDAPTADLMKAFYQQLQRNPDKAQALRQAMLTTLKTHPNPRDWAAFTLIGEAQR